MSIINKLASALGRRDEVPNQELAKEIAVKNDSKAVKELAGLLSSKSKNIQNDSIKVLYEIGYIKPGLISPYIKEFLALLDDKNNRLQWGGMTALGCIVQQDAKEIYSALPLIMNAADNGSVITRDQAVNILLKLGAVKQYAAASFSLLTEQLLKCPTNQLPMYAENAVSVINDKNKEKFIKTLICRLGDIERESGRRRVEKVIRKLSAN
jgi:hypothetical protein